MVTTTIYFVRHAQSDHNVKDDLTRPLTPKGMEDTKKVTKALKDRNITKIYSSPYQRTMATVNDLANYLGLDILTIDDFRERTVGRWVEDFKEFSRNQWKDFNYKLQGGESLREVQERNISALWNVISDNMGKNIVIGTHGTALSTIINYFNPKFGFDSFWNIIDRVPYIVCFQFEGQELNDIEELEIK
jgi:2,3-bisphosphoglycerate-dependent phosphoglycerate mutase